MAGPTPRASPAPASRRSQRQGTTHTSSSRRRSRRRWPPSCTRGRGRRLREPTSDREEATVLAYHFSEMPYPFVPPEVEKELRSARVIVPNSYCDPKIVADLYNRYLDEYEYADELGLEIMLNEHHQTMTCLDAEVPISAGALGRGTKRARVVILGSL